MNSVHIANLFLEIYSISLFLLMYLYLMFNKKSEKSKSRKYMQALTISIILLMVGDSAEWVFGGKEGLGVGALLMAGVTLFYISSGFISLFTILYVEDIMSRDVKVHKAFAMIGHFICIAQFISGILNLFIHNLYYLDENNYYVFKNSFWYNGLIGLGYVAVLVMIIIYHKNLPKRRLVNFCILTFLPSAGYILHLIFTEVTFIGPVYVMALLFVQASEKNNVDMKERELSLSLNQSLEDSQAYQEQLITEIITALAYSVEAKDLYTNGHSIRVARYVREIVYRMGYDEKQQMKSYYMGLLHDIGKIRIPDEIINKKARLIDEEYETIKLHTVSGFHILKAISALPELSIGARWHHERYDGKGYPNGLKGENIPLMARIIAVADAYDAMTSNRSYRQVMPQEKVREEIEKGKGTQFDPDIAQIMLDMIDADINYDMKQTKPKHKSSILVVDDDKMMHKFITFALADEDYLVTCVDNAAEAKKLFSEEDFDLCLLDVQMPDTNGFEMYEWILNRKYQQKVIFLSGDKDINTIMRATNLGVRDYITKPVKVTVLKETIKDVLIH